MFWLFTALNFCFVLLPVFSSDETWKELRNYQFTHLLPMPRLRSNQGVTKRCRLSWRANSALVNEPKCGGVRGVLRGLSLYSCTQEPKDLTPYLTYGSNIQVLDVCDRGDPAPPPEERWAGRVAGTEEWPHDARIQGRARQAHPLHHLHCRPVILKSQYNASISLMP